MRYLVDVGQRRRFADSRRVRIGLGPADEDAPFVRIARARRVVVVERDLDDFRCIDLAVIDPVVGSELDPRRGQQVEERDFLHRLAPGEQLAG